MMQRRSLWCWMVLTAALTATTEQAYGQKGAPKQSQAKLTKQQERILKNAFTRFDANKDGVIDKAEFPGSRQQWKELDKDGNGEVTPAEFRGSAQARRLLQATYRNDQEPRERTTAVGLRPERLAHLKRFDTNRDGKITRKEWTGAPSAFTTLDANQDGIIDRKDRDIARADAESTRPPELPKIQGRMESYAQLMKKYDKDKDKRLSDREAARHKDLRLAFRWADTDGDRYLEEMEIQRLLREVAARVQARNRGSGARARPYRVPFKTWDKDKDGRLTPEEWVQRRYLFSRIDADRDGAVTELEIERYIRSVEHEDFIGRFDLDGNGSVTRIEFGGPHAAFTRADRNGDGVVNRRDR